VVTQGQPDAKSDAVHKNWTARRPAPLRAARGRPPSPPFAPVSQIPEEAKPAEACKGLTSDERNGAQDRYATISSNAPTATRQEDKIRLEGSL
jgi:hypothetical protein